MNLNQMKYVIEVAASNSMREAATKLYVSQPALSSSIRELEEEISILIFDRSNKGITLTEEGREFLTHVKMALGQYQVLEDRYLTKEAMSGHDFKKSIKTDDRATSMEILAELDGYAIGSGMLSEENAILKGLVSIKLKEEDPLIIGYITRKGSTLSQYGKDYIEELLNYKEL